MAGLLDMILGGATPAAAQAGASQGLIPAPTDGIDPNATTPPPSASTQAPQGGVGDPAVMDLNVVAPRLHPALTPPPQQPSGPPGGGYNNVDDVNAINAVKGQYPQGDTGSGLGLGNLISNSGIPGGGFLRKMLGTVGDAFLISSGHAPIHAEQQYREQVANAAAGFQDDPGGAASRIAATGAPGSMGEAQTMYNTMQTQKLREAQQQSNNDYRNSNVAIRQEQADSQVAARQANLEQSARARMGSMIAAAGNDPAKFKSAIANATSLGSKYIKDFNPDLELPGSPDEVNAGYGMTAPQYQRNQTSQQSIQERATAAGNRNQVTMRGQDIGAGNNGKRVAATIQGQQTSMPGQLQAIQQRIQSGTATPQDQQMWAHATQVSHGGAGLKLPAGLQPGGAQRPGGTQQFSHTATGPNGKKIGFNGQAWVPIN